METDHEQVFAALRGRMSRGRPATRSKDSGQETVIAVMLSDIRATLAKRFGGTFDQQRLLRQAMEFEKDTITFFTMLKQSLKVADRKKVDDIIQEEVGHLLLLGGRLAATYGPKHRKSTEQRGSLGQFPA
jgi:rubrerythrin